MIVYFEGIDGVGKSTQIQKTHALLSGSIKTCEPGGTELGKKLREMIFRGQISPRAEILLFLADRAEHYEKIIAPNKDKIILSDRGFISGISYAMANADFDIEKLLELNSFALGGDFGDKFVFFKADESLIKARLMARNSSDSIEKRGIEYLLRVQGFMEILLKDLGLNYIEINANDEISVINKKIVDFIKEKK